ncbi:MAG: hypothetical protein PUD25_04505 [Bacilli bacterium]|nr:hypothetical protein [Bacilli bacterium]
MKMQISEDISAKNFLMIAFFSLFMFFLVFGWSINNFVQTKNYVKVKSIIIDVDCTCGEYSECTHYAKLEYQYDGKSYYTEQTLFLGPAILGSKISIYVNPENPEEVRDNYNTRIMMVLSLFYLFICCVIFKCYWIKKRQENDSNFDNKSDLGEKMLIRSPLK